MTPGRTISKWTATVLQRLLVVNVMVLSRTVLQRLVVNVVVLSRTGAVFLKRRTQFAIKTRQCYMLHGAKCQAYHRNTRRRNPVDDWVHLVSRGTLYLLLLESVRCTIFATFLSRNSWAQFIWAPKRVMAIWSPRPVHSFNYFSWATNIDSPDPSLELHKCDVRSWYFWFSKRCPVFVLVG